jgi:hypothetical protein
MDIQKLRAATPVPLPTSNTSPLRLATPPVVASVDALAWCLETFNRGPFPAAGGRNDWLATLGLFCNERGVPLAEIEAYALDHYTAADFPKREIEQTLRGIYTREAAAYNSKPYTPHNTLTNHMPTGLIPPPSLPLPATFPSDLYDALPDYLRRCCAPFKGHEKAVMLLGALAVLSGCFPAVGGTYNRRQFGLNLFTFIIAPAASGKGTLAWARRLAWPHHKALTETSRAARIDFDAELAAFRNAGKAKASLTPPPATPPAYKMLYLPGNTTAAALLTALAENDGRGIMCETEADTLTGALGTDFGNFSDVLRKSFQHEPISLLRKTDRQHLDLARPALSIALTGTPGQLPRLMPSAEDGLVSRFLFYTFAQAPTWQDVGPSAGPALDPYFDELAGELSQMIIATPLASEEGNNYPIEIKLTPADWQRLNIAGAAGLDEALAVGGEVGGSSAYRLGLIAWRVVGLLTVLRCFQNGEAPIGCLQADPADVGSALAIMNTARAHALTVLASLPAPAGHGIGRFTAKAGKEEQIRELHAQGLSLREIADRTGISKSTVDRWLTQNAKVSRPIFGT